VELGATVARIATHCTEADIAPQHIALAREMGMTVCGFLMMAHMLPPAELARQARIMEDAGAHVVYVVDSAGALLVEEARERVQALRDALQCEVGFHGHNNLGLGVANTIAALEAGATWLDGSLCGLGAGAGNTQLEVLAAVLDRMGIHTGVDLYGGMDAAEEVGKPLLPRPIVIDRDALVIGYAGVYSSFLLHGGRRSGLAWKPGTSCWSWAGGGRWAARKTRSYRSRMRSRSGLALAPVHETGRASAGSRPAAAGGWAQPTGRGESPRRKAGGS